MSSRNSLIVSIPLSHHPSFSFFSKKNPGSNWKKKLINPLNPQSKPLTKNVGSTAPESDVRARQAQVWADPMWVCRVHKQCLWKDIRLQRKRHRALLWKCGQYLAPEPGRRWRVRYSVSDDDNWPFHLWGLGWGLVGRPALCRILPCCNRVEFATTTLDAKNNKTAENYLDKFYLYINH